MQISQFFLNGDMKGALAYMRSHEEYKEILPAYTAIFEDCIYRTYEIPDMLNSVLRLYQVYFRDTFYCGLPEAEAADKLLTGLKHLLNMPDADEDTLYRAADIFKERKNIAAGYRHGGSKRLGGLNKDNTQNQASIQRCYRVQSPCDACKKGCVRGHGFAEKQRHTSDKKI